MRVAVLICAFFGMAWGCGAIAISGAPRMAFALPPAISLLVVLASRRLPPGDADPLQVARRRRLVRFWSLIEGVAMVIAIVSLQRIGAQGSIPSVMIIIMGVHFIPLARGVPQPIFYVSGAALAIAGAVSTEAATSRMEALIAASSAAILLWATGIAVIIARRRSVADTQIRPSRLG